MKNSIAILKRSLENVQSEHLKRTTALKDLQEQAKSLHAELDILEQQMSDINKAIEKLEGKHEQAAPKTKKTKR